jgi:hypothetical protein
MPKELLICVFQVAARPEGISVGEDVGKFSIRLTQFEKSPAVRSWKRSFPHIM